MIHPKPVVLSRHELLAYAVLWTMWNHDFSTEWFCRVWRFTEQQLQAVVRFALENSEEIQNTPVC